MVYVKRVMELTKTNVIRAIPIREEFLIQILILVNAKLIVKMIML